MTAPPPARRRPLLAVVYDLGSATPTTIRSAAQRLCDLAFVCDFDRPHVKENEERLRRLGTVVDVTGLDRPARTAAVRAAGPDGVLTFSEYRLAETAGYAEELGLPFHDAATVAVLTDKFAQRRRLAEAGVDATPCALLAGDLTRLPAEVGLPMVLKPRVGAGSADTVRVDTAEEFAAAAARLPAGTPFVAERLLAGAPEAAGPDFGDYVSVESVSTPDGRQQVCVTGKLPLAEPFRETGMFLPSSLDGPTAARVLALEAAALEALGVRHGVTHTEIKLTPDGPRIIEVNGRLGGYVPEILKRAAGVDLLQAAVRVALGLPPRLPAVRWTGVAYQCFLTPPTRVGTLRALEGAELLTDLPGVRKAELHAEPGRPLDWRQGTQSHLGVVFGDAPDHAALAAAVRGIAETVRIGYAD